jgi:hypothetical protein
MESPTSTTLMVSGASPLPASPSPSSTPLPGKHSTKYKVNDCKQAPPFLIFFFNLFTRLLCRRFKIVGIGV